LSLAILGILAMESLQSLRVGMDARSVVDLVRPHVEHFDSGNVIALARGLPAYGFGFFDCAFPLYLHGARPPSVQTAARSRSKTPIRHGALGVFLGNGRESLGCGGKREGMEQRYRKIQLLLGGSFPGSRGKPSYDLAL